MILAVAAAAFPAEPPPAAEAHAVAPVTLDQTVAAMLERLGPMGILGLYCWYVTTRTLPDKDAAITKERDSYLADAAREREAHRLTVDALVAEIKGQREALLEVTRKCQARP
jgi:hypothetical protein